MAAKTAVKEAIYLAWRVIDEETIRSTKSHEKSTK